MAWKWPAAAKNGTSEEWTGFIDQGVTLEGTLTVTGTFRIDGNVKGNIISEQTVILGEGAKVKVRSKAIAWSSPAASTESFSPRDELKSKPKAW